MRNLCRNLSVTIFLILGFTLNSYANAFAIFESKLSAYCTFGEYGMNEFPLWDRDRGARTTFNHSSLDIYAELESYEESDLLKISIKSGNEETLASVEVPRNLKIPSVNLTSQMGATLSCYIK